MTASYTQWLAAHGVNAHGVNAHVSDVMVFFKFLEGNNYKSCPQFAAHGVNASLTPLGRPTHDFCTVRCT